MARDGRCEGGVGGEGWALRGMHRRQWMGVAMEASVAWGVGGEGPAQTVGYGQPCGGSDSSRHGLKSSGRAAGVMQSARLHGGGQH